MNQDIRHNNGEEMEPAQEDVFKLYSNALHRFFYFRVHDNEIADDLAQETISRTFQARSELFNPGREDEIRPYLYATARHVFSNYVRDQVRHPTIELIETMFDQNSKRMLNLELMLSCCGNTLPNFQPLNKWCCDYNLSTGFP